MEGPAKRFCSQLFIEGTKVVGYRGYMYDITNIVIPNGIDAIADEVFEHCDELTSLTLPNSLESVGDKAFRGCSGLTSLTLPHTLVHVGSRAFGYCTALTSVVFRPPVSRGAFITWAVGSSRSRANWQLTTVRRLRNVLRLITTLALWSRDVAYVDADGSKGVFLGCPCNN